MSDVEYKAKLDDSDVLKSLKNIEKHLDNLQQIGEMAFSEMARQGRRQAKLLAKEMETTGEKSKRAFEKTQKGAKISGVQIGIVSGITQELTRRFIRMAEEAARAFLEIAKGGIELNKQLELTQIQITNVLGGNEEAAKAFMTSLRGTAALLRTDYVELASLAATILPQAKDFEATEDILTNAKILGDKAGQSITGIRIALQEALAGGPGLISLQRRLNVPPQVIDRIRELSKTMSQADAIAIGLAETVEMMGLNLESTADTFLARFAIIQAETKNLQQVLTAPIFEELKDLAEDFLDVFDEHKDDIEAVAEAFGRLAADIVKIVGTNLVQLFEGIDYQGLADTADAFRKLWAALDLIVSILTKGDFNSAMEGIAELARFIATAMERAAIAAALIRATYESLPNIQLAKGVASGRPTDIFVGLARLADQGVVSQDKFKESLSESLGVMDEYYRKLDEITEQAEARSEATEDDTQSQLEAAQADLDRAAALEELEQAASDAAEAREKLSDKLAKIAIDRERKLTEIYRDQTREQLEDAIEFAQKREDIARKNADKLEDIARKHQQSISDAATDLSRDEEDIARRASRDRAEVERDAARERLDVERDYRRELQRIRDRFNESAAEAERRNDAQAFLEAVRQQAREVNEAKRTRAEGIEDAGQRAAEQREKVNEQLQFELEDARIANRRKLEDLQLRLEREIEAQRINYEREQAEQRLDEERKKTERDRANAQELEDFGRKESQKLADLTRSEAAQLEIVRKYEALKRGYRVAEAKRTVAEVNAALARVNPFGSARTSTPFGRALTRVPFMQEGGPVDVGKPYIVGERGPELFVPGQSGVIVPQVVALPAPPAAQNISNVSTTVSPNFNVSESLFNDPVAVRKLENIILGVMAGSL